MAKYRVTTYYTASIDTDIIADSKEDAIEQVRADETRSIEQDDLRPLLDDIQESWTQSRTAWNLTDFIAQHSRKD